MHLSQSLQLQKFSKTITSISVRMLLTNLPILYVFLTLWLKFWESVALLPLLIKVIYCSSFLCCILFGCLDKVNDKCIVNVFQIDSEFMRKSTVPLLSTFFAGLDQHSPRMLEIFRSKGGAPGRKIRHLMVAMSKVCIKMGMLMKYVLCPCHF